MDDDMKDWRKYEPTYNRIFWGVLVAFVIFMGVTS